jgi:hypothetical protein
LPIVLYFSSHEAEAITPHLRQLFAEADIVLIEQAFRDEDGLTLNLVNELSRGNLLPEDVSKIGSGVGVQFVDFSRGLGSMIFRSGKQIMLENSPFDVTDAVAYDGLVRQEFRNVPVRIACTQLTENLRKRAGYDKKRDEALVEQLRDLTNLNPNAHILIIRGRGHRNYLEKTLAVNRIHATSLTAQETMVSTLTDEVMQKIIADERPTRMELLRSLVELSEIETIFTHPTQANIRVLRARISGMNERQCEKFLRKKLNLTS